MEIEHSVFSLLHSIFSKPNAKPSKWSQFTHPPPPVCSSFSFDIAFEPVELSVQQRQRCQELPQQVIQFWHVELKR